MPELTIFHLTLCSTDLTERTAKIMNKLVGLFTIPPKYHEFTDVFSKAKVETLAPHCLYDLQIKLENKEKLFIRMIYSLLTTK